MKSYLEQNHDKLKEKSTKDHSYDDVKFIESSLFIAPKVEERKSVIKTNLAITADSKELAVS